MHKLRICYVQIGEFRKYGYCRFSQVIRFSDACLSLSSTFAVNVDERNFFVLNITWS